MRVGGSDFGGIYAGRDVQSEPHRHHFVVLVLSLGGPFRIVCGKDIIDDCRVAILPKDTSYSLSTSRDDFTIFAHFDPYSTDGLLISPEENQIQVLKFEDFLPILPHVRKWVEEASDAPNATESLLEELAAVVTSGRSKPREIDSRIVQVIESVVRIDPREINLRMASGMVFLSPTRFSHLFKQETGVSFRKFVQHRKLVLSLKSLHHSRSLTEAAIGGGFADQPHFIRTFRGSFGIKPSKSTE